MTHCETVKIVLYNLWPTNNEFLNIYSKYLSIFDRVACILWVRHLLKRVPAAEALNVQTHLNSSFEPCKYSMFAVHVFFLSLRTDFSAPLKKETVVRLFPLRRQDSLDHAACEIDLSYGHLCSLQVPLLYISVFPLFSSFITKDAVCKPRFSF